jgi:hypothetical protein
MSNCYCPASKAGGFPISLSRAPFSLSNTMNLTHTQASNVMRWLESKATPYYRYVPHTQHHLITYKITVDDAGKPLTGCVYVSLNSEGVILCGHEKLMSHVAVVAGGKGELVDHVNGNAYMHWYIPKCGEYRAAYK